MKNLQRKKEMLYFLPLKTSTSLDQISWKVFVQLIEQRVPSSSIEVCLQKVIERPHVLFFGEENMVRNVLHNLTHKRQTSFHALRRL